MSHDPLTFLPIPLATGEVTPGQAGDCRVRRISVTIETADGASRTHELVLEGGGWRMPTDAVKA